MSTLIAMTDTEPDKELIRTTVTDMATVKLPARPASAASEMIKMRSRFRAAAGSGP